MLKMSVTSLCKAVRSSTFKAAESAGAGAAISIERTGELLVGGVLSSGLGRCCKLVVVHPLIFLVDILAYSQINGDGKNNSGIYYRFHCKRLITDV